jgi:hypothetical protein
MTLFATVAYTQDFNPPYPRLGIFTFSGLTKASVDILEKFDIVTIALDNDMARRYKEANPKRIVLRNDNLVAYNVPIEVPDQWRAKSASGENIAVWDGAYIMNVTRFCPKVDIGHGPETYVDWLLRSYRETMDFQYFDGIMYDWWWSGLSQGDDVVDFNNNRVPDRNEMDVDGLWRDSIAELHRRETAEVPGLKYVIVQIGEKWVTPYVNGADYEDWPDFHGQWQYWKDYHLDESWAKNTEARKPTLVLLNAAHTLFMRYGLSTEPYKNTYRAIRFALGSVLLGPAFIFSDEGNGFGGHHGNFHYYDEFEGKGMLGYPLGDGRQLPGKPQGSSPNCSGVWVRYFENGVSVVNVSGVDQTITESDFTALDPRPGSGYYRIKGGQDPLFNNGKRVTNADPLKLWGTTVKRHWPDYDPVGDGTMLFRKPTTLIAPIVVDNTVNNQTSPGSDPVEVNGRWLEDDGDEYYAYYTGRESDIFQRTAFVACNRGSGENTAKYTPTIGVAGYYEVFEWHGYFGGSPGAVQEATNVPFKISYSGGEKTVTVNQSANYGRWNSLGTYFFNTGKGGYVIISNNTDGPVIADAVKFVYRGADPNRDSTAPMPPQGVRVFNQ